MIRANNNWKGFVHEIKIQKPGCTKRVENSGNLKAAASMCHPEETEGGRWARGATTKGSERLKKRHNPRHRVRVGVKGSLL